MSATLRGEVAWSARMTPESRPKDIALKKTRMAANRAVAGKAAKNRIRTDMETPIQPGGLDRDTPPRCCSQQQHRQCSAHSFACASQPSGEGQQQNTPGNRRYALIEQLRCRLWQLDGQTYIRQRRAGGDRLRGNGGGGAR